MNRALSQRLEEEIPKRLAELLAVPLNRIKVQRQPAAGRGKPEGADLLVAAGDFNFVVEWKTAGQAAAVAMAARAVQQLAAQWKKKSIPLVAVPYMGEVGRRLCEEADVCWLDLSGNAHLVAPGLRVTIEGKPNQFKRPGRPRSVFTPKSARIVRRLLIEPENTFTQRALAKAAGLDEGFTSRIVRQLEEQRLVARDAAGELKVADYDALLDAWREAYDFSKHHIERGHIAARSGDEILRRVSDHPSFLPLRLGGTCQDLWIPGKIRPGGFGAQQQGRASRIRPESPGRDSDPEGLRAEAGGQRQCHCEVDSSGGLIASQTKKAAFTRTRLILFSAYN
jgi:hypothetical protein